jgi:hypothetical protein
MSHSRKKKEEDVLYEKWIRAFQPREFEVLVGPTLYAEFERLAKEYKPGWMDSYIKNKESIITRLCLGEYLDVDDLLNTDN